MTDMMRFGGLIGLLLLGPLCGCGGDQPKTVEELRDAGIKAFVNGENAEARELLTAGLRKAPSNRDLLYFTGMAYKRDFMYDSALVYLRRSALLHQGDREVAQAMYDVAISLRQWEIAFSALGTLMATGDPEQKWLEELADLSMEMNRPLNQWFYLRKYLALHPEDSLRYIQAANVSMMVDSAAAGLTIIDSALTRFGETPKRRATRAVVLGALRRFGEGEAILRDLLARDTGNASIKLNLANVLRAQDSKTKHREAIKLYREVEPEMGDSYPIDSLIRNLESGL